jgi:hypothetical protein
MFICSKCGLHYNPNDTRIEGMKCEVPECNGVLLCLTETRLTDLEEKINRLELQLGSLQRFLNSIIVEAYRECGCLE